MGSIGWRAVERWFRRCWTFHQIRFAGSVHVLVRFSEDIAEKRDTFHKRRVAQFIVLLRRRRQRKYFRFRRSCHSCFPCRESEISSRHRYNCAGVMIGDIMFGTLMRRKLRRFNLGWSLSIIYASKNTMKTGRPFLIRRHLQSISVGLMFSRLTETFESNWFSEFSFNALDVLGETRGVWRSFPRG